MQLRLSMSIILSTIKTKGSERNTIPDPCTGAPEYPWNIVSAVRRSSLSNSIARKAASSKSLFGPEAERVTSKTFPHVVSWC